ncbi:UNVERIFIED_CONTAM: hypothetical protein FKN15_067388 [Acipenser sinensis]
MKRQPTEQPLYQTAGSLAVGVQRGETCEERLLEKIRTEQRSGRRQLLNRDRDNVKEDEKKYDQKELLCRII